MARTGRNDPCPCGSGRKAKRCCGLARGPSESDLARAYLAVQRQQASSVVIGCDQSELAELIVEVLRLPERELSLAMPLPAIVTPELQRLARAVADDDADEIDATLDAVIPTFDTPLIRAHLARSLIRLRDEGAVEAKTAAVALVHLGGRTSGLLRAALTQAVAVSYGAAATPSGIVVARG